MWMQGHKGEITRDPHEFCVFPMFFCWLVDAKHLGFIQDAIQPADPARAQAGQRPGSAYIHLNEGNLVGLCCCLNMWSWNDHMFNTCGYIRHIVVLLTSCVANMFDGAFVRVRCALGRASFAGETALSTTLIQRESIAPSRESEI